MKTPNPQEIHRASIALVERHQVSIDEAIEQLHSFNLSIVVGAEIRTSIPLQAALVSAVNAGSRIFLGGIKCYLNEVVPNFLPLPGKTLNDIVQEYGAVVCQGQPNENEQKLAFGKSCEDKFTIEVVCSGWQAGVNFFEHERTILQPSDTSVIIGGVCASSLALFYMFNRQFLELDNLFEFPTGISLWDPGAEYWAAPQNEGPSEVNTPKNVWSVGLGHLGQAYLWTLGLQSNPEHEYLYALQDEDFIGLENIGSQVLSFEKDIGERKARVCSKFLENLGVRTQIVEKPFLKVDQNQEWSSKYKVLLTGVDNVVARRSIDKSFFNLCLDGGTNGRLQLFDSFTFRNLNHIDKSVDEIWKSNSEEDAILNPNFYDQMEKSTGCGQLFNKAISTPFMGLFGASILVSEILRGLNKGKQFSAISVQLRNLTGRNVVGHGNYQMEHLSLASFEE